MSKSITNAEKLPELVDRLTDRLKPVALHTLTFLLNTYDGQVSNYDVEAIARNFGAGSSEAAHISITSMANMLCQELGIEPPLVIIQKGKPKRASASGKAVLHLLEGSVENAEMAVQCSDLEFYIRDGILAETTSFSSVVCDTVITHLVDRHHNEKDPFKLSGDAMNRFIKVQADIHSRHSITIVVEPTEVPTEQSVETAGDDEEVAKESVQNDIEVEPEVDYIAEFASEYPESEDLITKVADYVLDSAENLSEEEWEQLELERVVFAKLALLINERFVLDGIAKARLEIVANTCGLSRLPVSDAPKRTSFDARPNKKSRSGPMGGRRV
jgi:hypothetical protein